MTRWRIWLGQKASDSTAGQPHTRSRAIRTSVAGAPVVGARIGVIQDLTERRARRGLVRHKESEAVMTKRKMTTDVADLESEMYRDGPSPSAAEVDGQIRQIEALLSTLDAADRAAAHYAAAVLLARREITGDPVAARIMEHAKRAAELDETHAGAWRMLSHAYRRSIREPGHYTPDTYTDHNEKTWLVEDLSPEDIEELWSEIERRQPLANEAIRCAARAHSLSPMDDLSVVAVKMARDARLELFWLEDGLAHAPIAMGPALLELGE